MLKSIITFALSKHIFTFLLSFSLAIYVTPIMREAALRFGIVDKPDGELKKHEKPVPYLGGLAVYLSFLISLALVFDFNPQVLALLLAGTIVIILGLIDDFGFLTPGIKLAGQLIAVWVLIKGGIYIKLEFLPTTFGVPIAAYLLSVLWLVGLTNAFNIIDVMDGLAASVGAAASLVLFGVALMNDRPTIVALTIALAGALGGFLRYNRAPAQIYLGDTGSMFIGLMLGSLAMIGSYTEHNTVALLAPVMILGVPIFDTFLVMVIRKLKGRPIMWGSPDHYALRLRKKGWAVNTIVGVSTLATLILGGTAYFLMQLKNTNLAFVVVSVVAVIGLVIAFLMGRIDMPEPDKKEPEEDPE